jgi:HK97 family phage prohead protease
MLEDVSAAGLETKFCRIGRGMDVTQEGVITGYASVFGKADQGGDIVSKGAYRDALGQLAKDGRAVKMLWQHDPAQPIGIWDEVREDERGLFVKGRFLTDVRQGAEALALVQAGAIDGLSIGYRTKRAERNAKGQRLLHELELWEVSLVTFPMLPEARVQGKAEADGFEIAEDLAEVFSDASRMLAEMSQQ